MSTNKEEIKNKIVYRASYRGTKEMDILMIKFVNSIINELSFSQLLNLDHLVNLSDEDLINLKKNNIVNNKIDSFILKKFVNFNL